MCEWVVNSSRSSHANNYVRVQCNSQTHIVGSHARKTKQTAATHTYHWNARVLPFRLATPPGYRVNRIPTVGLVPVTTYSQLTRSKFTSRSTAGPITPSRPTPAPPSVRVSERTRASSARQAGVELPLRKGALSTSTSVCIIVGYNAERRDAGQLDC